MGRDNRLLFERMMSELDLDVLHAEGLAKGPFEVALMALIFQQQKTITRLMKEIEKMFTSL